MLCMYTTNSIFYQTMKLKCRHEFHTTCLMKYIYENNKKCPCCHESKVFPKELVRESYELANTRCSAS